jgi:pseudaminic acid cytidylyltransferase
MMGRLAIIPARGGSKRLPRKNVADFLGKPIIAYTIEAALGTKLFDRVVVSTEDAEIADVATRYGAVVDRRDVALATDTATVAEVCLCVLGKERDAGREYDVLCCLYATAPLRNAWDIEATVRLLESERCDYAVAVTKYSYYPFQALKLTERGRLEPMWPEYVDRRSHEIGPLFAGNGSTYAVTVKAFESTRNFYGPNMRGHVMPPIRSVDIDEQEDLDVALCFARLGGS